MMRMKDKPTDLSSTNGSAAGRGGESGSEWEIRPGGMLVQKRNPDFDRSSAPAPTIRVRVKYGSIYHEISISSQATFGDLKKILTGPTGLHHQDQKLIYKDKERDSKAFLDNTGVKDRSKMVLVEDPISQERRLLEMRKNAKTEKASKFISEISLEVDRLAGQVSAFESIITKGGKVAEKDLLTLIELLMNQLLKLDGIMADGDAKLQRKMQVRRVQKYVETLDLLKVKNSTPNSNGGQIPKQNQRKYSNGQKLAPIQEHPLRHSNGQRPTPVQEHQQPRHSFGHGPIHQQQQPLRHSTSGPAVVTTKWETFDSTPALIPASTSTSANNNSVQPKFNWELFD
ncbi:BAG family molecular chaperone regulator 1 [Tripterygium wilfordii]|uniref:BAG family molecular chaperone regulator 1 n=1 Tax=Tripterygium wilfordii TaxID=458696 RepID=A0A7J7CAD8_TRIWF|nr:BAG family molecular chaperone regulator 1-like [Tripterygium wilfordii]KAF5731131.1 BAG family molecular chaperone regulator 1 [Tripterygium wilfordii]